MLGYCLGLSTDFGQPHSPNLNTKMSRCKNFQVMMQMRLRPSESSDHCDLRPILSSEIFEGRLSALAGQLPGRMRHEGSAEPKTSTIFSYRINDV